MSRQDTEVSGRQHLRSASHRKMNIPPATVSSQHIWHLRAFSVAGPKVWDPVPDSLRDPAVESERVSAGLENASLCRQTLET